MPAPSTTVTLRKSQARLNPQDLSGITCFIGTTSIGTVNTPQTQSNTSTLRTTAGYSPTCSAIAETLGVAGAPVYVCPSAQDNAGVVASVVKVPNSAGVITYVGGYLKLAGADSNGDIGFQSREGGITFSCAVGANSATVTGSTGAWTVALTCPAAASSLFETFWLSADAGATAARALVSATFYGTKASNANSTPITATPMDNGAITLTAPTSGYRYKLTTGSSQVAAASYSTLDLTIALGCDINSEPTGIASAMVTLINAITGKVVAAPVGAGTGILGILPSSFTALQYGSTAAMTLSGNPTDYMPSIVVQTVRGGALGTATIKWTIDGQVGPAPATSTLSAETLVPASGIVALSGANFTSGLTATFTGVLEGPGAGAGVAGSAIGDRWTSSATAPTSSVASLVAAATAALNDNTRSFGIIAVVQPMTLSDIVTFDALIQSTFSATFCEAIVAGRDLNYGSSETDAAFTTAIQTELLAFHSAHGLTAVAVGGVVHSDVYTGYTYGPLDVNGAAVAGRPTALVALARNASIPAHENLGRVATGQIRNVTGASHDERVNPGLADKFICTQSYREAPGGIYFSGAATTADPVDPAYTQEPWVSLACQVSRIAKLASFPFTLDTIETISVAEGNGVVPKGAITVAQQAIIESTVTAPIEAFLFKPKTDGRPSANRLPDTDSSGAPLKTVTARRDYSAKDTGELRLDVLFSRLGFVYSIDIGVTLA